MKKANEYIIIARKYRPQQFDEIIGQEHVRTTLINAIKADRVAHAYIFSGPKGIGKTTIARILAKSLNCAHGPTPTPCDKCTQCLEIIKGNNMDVMEIDGASNRGIDQIRELRENIKFAASGSRFKIYIIDEVHMLTTEAFNALLKTLEEPPPHVKFFFATTEINKIPATIASRCQRFELHRIKNSQIIGRLRDISDKEKIKINPKTLETISRCANGSMRDAESILDKLIAYSGTVIEHQEALSILGIVDKEILFEISGAIAEGNIPQLLVITTKIFEQGKDLHQFLLDLASHFRNILLAKYTPETHGLPLIELSPEDIDKIITSGKQFTQKQLLDILHILIELQGELKWSLSKRITLELGMIKIVRAGKKIDLDQLISRLEQLEHKLHHPSPHTAPETATTALPHPSTEKPARPEQRVEQTIDFWDDILTNIGRRNPLLKSYLAEGTPVKLSHDILTVDFDPSCSLHYESLSKEKNKELIEKRISEHTGYPVKINFRITDTPLKNKTLKSSTSKTINNPLVENVRRKFGAKIVTVKTS